MDIDPEGAARRGLNGRAYRWLADFRTKFVTDASMKFGHA